MTRSSLPEPLRYTVTGPDDGIPVVLLHGWGSSAAVMSPIARRLSDRCRVFNVDLPGHGEAPEPTAPWDLERHSQAVADLIDKHIGAACAVIGHSNGGRIALFMAGHPTYSGRIERLVLISPSGIQRPRSLGYYVRRSVATALKAPFGLLPEPLRAFGLDWLRHSFVWSLLGSSDYRQLSGVMRDTFVCLVNAYVEDGLASIRQPVLLVWGDADTAIVRPQIDRLLGGIPDAGLVVLPGAGHFGFLDQPELFIAATRHFLVERS